MQTQYRADFFDRGIEHTAWSLMSVKEIELDYLTLDSSKGVIPRTGAGIQRGWYIHLTCYGKPCFDGVVTAVADDGKVTTVSFAPLLTLLNVSVISAPTYTGTAEAFIAGLISDTFITNADTVERIPGLTVSTTSATSNVTLGLEGNVHELYKDIITPALTAAQIVVSMELNLNNKAVICTVGTAPPTPIGIKADTSVIIDKSFSFRDDYGTVNKVIVVNKDKISQQSVYYAREYAAPTVRKVVEISLSSGDTWATKAKEAADKELEVKDFNNCIELSFPSDCKLIPPIAIGQEVNVYHQGKKYVSFLTAQKISDGITTLVCGSVRLELTKILRMEGNR